MGNIYSESALVEFNISNKNGIIKRLIQELIITKQDLDELRESLKCRKNKIHTVLCEMKERKIKIK